MLKPVNALQHGDTFITGITRRPGKLVAKWGDSGPTGLGAGEHRVWLGKSLVGSYSFVEEYRRISGYIKVEVD